MKAIIEFDLNDTDDKDAHLKAVYGDRMYGALDDIILMLSRGAREKHNKYLDEARKQNPEDSDFDLALSAAYLIRDEYGLLYL